MTSFVRWLSSALSVYFTAALIPGIRVKSFIWALIAALIIGFLNTIIKPILQFFSFPLLIITLGLFSLVINAFLLWSAGAILQGFEVDGFWPALWGSIVISISNAFIFWLLKPAQKVYQQ